MQTLKMRCSDALHDWLREKAARRSVSVVAYLIQLADADCVADRLQKLHKQFPLPERAEPKILLQNGDRRRKLTAEQVQTALFLFDSEDMSVTAIAARFNVGRQTIDRIIQARKRSAIRTPNAPRATHHGQRWGDSGGGRQRAQEAQSG